MRNLTLDNVTDTALASFAALPGDRRRLLVQRLVASVHAFAKDVNLTHEEWRGALGFLHRLGDISSDSRSEFSLLSDVTGLSSLVDMLASAHAGAGATPGSVLGPFHTAGSPWMGNPADLIGANAGRRVLLRGRVCRNDGSALPQPQQASIDFWQNAADGLYWQQDPNQPTDNLRCQLHLDKAGRFEIATIRPVPYQIPLDGPVWNELVQPAGLSGWRPAHFHLIAMAPGHRTLVTELFDAEDPYLDNDAVFGVRQALVGQYRAVADAALCARLGVPGPDALVMDVELRLGALTG